MRARMKRNAGFWKCRVAIPLFFCLLAAGQLSAQRAIVQVKGIVIGSEEGNALAGVHIFARKMKRGYISNSRGAFDLQALERDTLIFSHIGFHTERIAVIGSAGETMELLLRMRVKPIELDGITIESEPESPYLRRSQAQADLLPWRRPPTYDTTVTDVPLGSLSYGPLSYFSAEAKEKRRLMKYYQEERADMVYNLTVSSDSVRTVFMDRYGLSRTEYDDFLFYFHAQPLSFDRYDRKSILKAMHDSFLRYIDTE